MIVGSRWTLGAALLAAAIAALPGVLLGVLSGFFRPTLDAIISRVIDLLLAFPRLLLAMGIIAILGHGLLNVAFATGLTGIPVVARVVRSAVVAQSGESYIEAARAVGASDWRIVRRHVWPNVVGSVFIIGTLQMGWAVLDVSALSFLGLGPALGTPEWGTMLNDGRLTLREAPWAVLAPGLALALTVLDINLFGDALRDRLSRRHH
jgi:ABC-type dipeptide/oligopeptide/nickel transport system permease subunit